VKYFAVLFDLDGTLLDTLQDIGGSMNAALARMGYGTHEVTEYKRLVGEGVVALARKALPQSARENEPIVKACVAALRDEYARHCLDATVPYPGIPEMLANLQDAGVKTAVLSNKPDDMVKMLVRKYFPSIRFKAVLGARDGIPRKPDPAGAAEAARLLAVDPARCIFLGDSKTDMETAVAAGMFPVGALWGFRDAGELRHYGARRLISTPGELLEILEGRQNANVDH
jgi:phosphoglycolate phosphatase